MSNYINDHLSEEQILGQLMEERAEQILGQLMEECAERIQGQLMEECAEQIQAARKVIRDRQGVNKPHGGCDYIASLEEEIADVILRTALLSSVDGIRLDDESHTKRIDGKRG
jgi:NTP pyrophosphatase (non-canonical NTP hydrolase)